MQTPFFGISVLFHVGIIFVRTFFVLIQKVLKLEGLSTNKVRKDREIVNALLMLVVFLSVSYGAFFIVLLSLKDEYSTVQLVGHYFSPPVDVMAVMDQHEFLSQDNVIGDTCFESFVFAPTRAGEDLMLVDYLISVSMDHSFSARRILAESHGIMNYTGTKQQNTTLLEKLKFEKDSFFQDDIFCQNSKDVLIYQEN